MLLPKRKLSSYQHTIIMGCFFLKKSNINFFFQLVNEKKSQHQFFFSISQIIILYLIQNPIFAYCQHEMSTATPSSLEHKKLNWILLQVNVPPSEMQALINAGLQKLPPNHFIQTIRYLEIQQEGGCLLGIFSSKQAYFNHWREYIVPLLGETYAKMLTMDIQHSFKSNFLHLKKYGIVLYNNSPATIITTAPEEGPEIKRIKLVLPTTHRAVCVIEPPAADGVEPVQRIKLQAQLRDAFDLNDSEKTKLLKLFLTDSKPWNDPVPPPQRKATEKAHHFAMRLRESNKSPKHWDCFKAFFPPCARNPDKYLPMVDLSSPEPIIRALHAFYTGKGWTGFLGLFPSPDMQETAYGFTSPAATKATCVFEGIRRALKLEGALASQGQYMAAVVGAAGTLTAVALSTQHSVRLLLEFNGGGATIDARLYSGPLSPKIAEVKGFMEELQELRPEAFKPRYVQGTQLGWMLSSLGFLYANSPADVRAEGALEALLAAVKKEWSTRAQIYSDCAAPLFKYGGLLTRWLLSPSAASPFPFTDANNICQGC